MPYNSKKNRSLGSPQPGVQGADCPPVFDPGTDQTTYLRPMLHVKGSWGPEAGLPWARYGPNEKIAKKVKNCLN